MSRTPYREDIYDLDSLLDKNKEPLRPGRTYTVDKYGNLVPSRNRPKVKDDRVKLPKVPMVQPRGPAGQTRGQTRSGMDLAAMTGGARLAENNRNADRPQRNTGHLRTREPSPEAYFPCYHSPASRLEQTSPTELNTRPSAAIEDTPKAKMTYKPAIYANLSPKPPTPNVTVPAPPKAQLRYKPAIYAHLSPKPPTPNILARDLPTAQKANHMSVEPHMYTDHAPKAPKPNAHVPAPPTSQKSDSTSYSKSRRRVRYRNQELDQDVSVHKTTAPELPKPCKPVEITDDDIEREVQEAIDTEKRFAALDEQIKKLKAECAEFSGIGSTAEDTKKVESTELSGSGEMEVSTGAAEVTKKDSVDDFLKELDDMLKTPPPVKRRTRNATRSIMNAGSDDMTASRITTEPMKQWDGQTAKRGVGFKSKLKKEEPRVCRADDDIIPARVRRQMEERFERPAKF